VILKIAASTRNVTGNAIGSMTERRKNMTGNVNLLHLLLPLPLLLAMSTLSASNAKRRKEINVVAAILGQESCSRMTKGARLSPDSFRIYIFRDALYQDNEASNKGCPSLKSSRHVMMMRG
jgi:hypothetical protein